MSNVIVRTTNWIKSLALVGMMVAMVSTLAVAPGASAASVSLTANPVPITSLGKISVLAHDATRVTGIAGATVVVRQYNSDVVVLKGTTDSAGRFSSYIAAGTYQVTITAKGYKEFNQLAKIAAGQPTTLDAGLLMDAPPPPVNY